MCFKIYELDFFMPHTPGQGGEQKNLSNII